MTCRPPRSSATRSAHRTTPSYRNSSTPAVAMASVSPASLTSSTRVECLTITCGRRAFRSRRQRLEHVTGEGPLTRECLFVHPDYEPLRPPVGKVKYESVTIEPAVADRVSFDALSTP